MNKKLIVISIGVVAICATWFARSGGSSDASNRFVSQLAVVQSACTDAQLAVNFIGAEGAGGNFAVAAFAVTNDGSSCSISSAPSIELLDASGHQLPTVLTLGATGLVKDSATSPVSLDPNAEYTLQFEYQRISATAAACPVVSAVTITLPGNTQPLSISTSNTNGVALAPCSGQITLAPIASGPPK